MNKTQMNLQDLFLNQVRKEATPVTIYLVSGVQLKGMVKGFDAFTVVLDTPGKPPQLVYKHAMASVVPMRPIALREVFAPAVERAAAARAAVSASEESAAPEMDNGEE
jgi:host factor-I protein